MAVSDEDVQAARDRVDALREEVQAEKVKGTSLAMEGVNAYRKESLDNEAKSLEAELTALREANDPATLAKLSAVGTGPMATADAAPEPGEASVPTTPATSGSTGGLSSPTTTTTTNKEGK